MAPPSLHRRSWLAVLALVVPLVVVGGSAVAGDTATVTVLQLNLCGSGYATCWTGRSALRAAEVIRRSRPDVVTLNEACAADLPALQSAVSAARGRRTGARVAFAAAVDRRTGEPIRCRRGNLYGEAVIAWAPSASHVATTSGTYRDQDPGQAERRVWVCLSTDRSTACTTHLTSGSRTTARAQCTQLLDEVLPAARGRRPGRPVVVAGDLNLLAPVEARTQPRLVDCLSPGGTFLQAHDGVQHVLSPDLVPGPVRRLDMQRTTDHPGLLVTLSPVR